MRIYKSEKLWAVSIDVDGHPGLAFLGGAFGIGYRIFATKKLCKQWISGESAYFLKAYKPRPCRVLVTVEGER